MFFTGGIVPKLVVQNIPFRCFYTNDIVPSWIFCSGLDHASHYIELLWRVHHPWHISWSINCNDRAIEQMHVNKALFKTDSGRYGSATVPWCIHPGFSIWFKRSFYSIVPTANPLLPGKWRRPFKDHKVFTSDLIFHPGVRDPPPWDAIKQCLSLLLPPVCSWPTFIGALCRQVKTMQTPGRYGLA